MRGLSYVSSMLIGFAMLTGPVRAAGEDQKAKWEDMKKKHDECLKSSGAFDQKVIDALGECHKSMMKDHDKMPEKGDHEAMKGMMDSCLKDKGLSLTDAQREAMKGCHRNHDKHDNHHQHHEGK